MIGVIMAGGSGKRFWPASRKSLPKQFLSLPGSELSLIGQTLSRIERFSDEQFVVCGKSQASLMSSHLPDLEILQEPCARNTAPCLIYAAVKVLAKYGDQPMCVFPADHVIEQEGLLAEIFSQAGSYVQENDVLLTIGLVPTRPDTGYGYIKKGGRLGGNLFQVECFVEKPQLEVAEGYVTSGDYLWNSGMFVWRPSTLLAAVEEHAPELASGIKEIKSYLAGDITEDDFDQIFAALPSESIDNAVMEKAKNTVVIPGEGLGWSDIGTWDVWANFGVDSDSHVKIDSKNSVVFAGEKLVALVDVDDVIVVDTPDGLLVCKRGSSQKVKNVVEHLEKLNKTDVL